VSRATFSRPLLAAAVTCVVSLVAGCGASEGDPDAGDLGASVEPTPTAAATTPATTHTPTPTPRPTPSASATTADQLGGDGDAEGDNEPASKGGGICRYVGAEEVAAVLGTAVVGSAVPGETGCTFEQGGNQGLSVTMLDKSVAAAGGMDGAKSEANSAVEGTPKDLSGIGSAAFVITGSMFGGPDVNGAGAVRVGDRIVSVYLTQHSQLPESKVRALEVGLLKLVAQEAP
jgi:hypothetical protein